MGYFDGLVAGSFRTDEQGNHFVAPFGVFGKMRRFRTEQDYVKARKYLVGFYQVMMTVVIVGAVAVQWTPWWYMVPVFAALLLFSVFVVLPRIRRNSDPTNVRDTYGDALERSGKAHSGVQLFLLFLVSVAFIAIGIWLALRGETVGYLAAGFSGLCALVLGTMMVLRR